jgi:hypothetical protein
MGSSRQPRLQAEHPDRATYRFFARNTQIRRGRWRKCAYLRSGANADLRITTGHKPHQPFADAGRSGHEPRVPGLPGGLSG